MNTYKPDHIFCKAKARHQCFVLILCFHLALGDVPGPCRHSVTKDHLENITRLIENQLKDGCSIIYKFTERQSLSKTCYVKAAFPKILDLLQTHFEYVKSSDNDKYVFALKRLVLDIYSQKCIPVINEEIEDNPDRFQKVHRSSPREALEKAQEVIKLYMELMTENNTPVDWNCEREYAEDYPEFTTPIITQTTGATQCHCSCPTLGQVSLLATSPWNGPPKPTLLQPPYPLPPGPSQALFRTVSSIDPDHKIKIASIPPEENEKMFRVFSSPTDSPKSNLVPSYEGNDGLPAASASPTMVQSEPVSMDLDISDYVAESTVSYISTATKQVTEDFEDSRDPYNRNPSFLTSGFKESPTQSGISTFTTGDFTHETFIKSNNVIISPLKEFVDHSISTPFPFHDVPIGVTPDGPDENTAILLVKRSVDPKLNKFNSKTPNWITGKFPEVPGLNSQENWPKDDLLGDANNLVPSLQVSEQARNTARSTESSSSILPLHDLHAHTDNSSPVSKRTPISMGIAEEEVVGPGLGSQVPEDLTNSSTSDKPAGDSANDSQHEMPGDSDKDSYKAAFIIASVCLGLLLTIILFCYRMNQKTKELLQRKNMAEDQSLNVSSSHIEMECCETTQQSGLVLPCNG